MPDDTKTQKQRKVALGLPNLTLGQKRQLFSRLIVRLISKAHRMGFEVSVNEVYRSAAAAEANAKAGKGIANSLHCDGLAIDLNLFKPNDKGKLVYLRRTEDHRELGEWWEKQHPLCTWGGRFNDGNHYSIQHNGRK